MEFEKISVIIPVYKVEPFLDRCVDSVLKQAYPNLEVILVDDGSPDRCGAMCDAWAQKYPSIHVIHKENGGLSSARNAGIEEASGEFLVFIDSDDYISPDMIAKLHHALVTNDADMSICNICYVDENGKSLEKFNSYSPIMDELLTGQEAILKECDSYHKGWYYIFTWNKLYKKSLFCDIRFPAGKLSEDDFTTHKVYLKCNRIACIKDIGYYYTQRAGSILGTNSRVLSLHQAEGRLERASLCYTHGLYRSAGLSYWQAAMALPDACRKDSLSTPFEKELNTVIRTYRRLFYLRKHCTLKEKIQTFLVFIDPVFYRVIFRSNLKFQIKRLLYQGVSNSAQNS